MSDSDRPPPRVAIPPHKETVQGIGAPLPRPLEREREEASPSQKPGATDEAEGAFLAFLDASKRGQPRSTPPSTGDTPAPPASDAPKPPPAPRASAGASGVQLAAFAAVVVGATALGYAWGKTSLPPIQVAWSAKQRPPPAPMTPCLPPVEVEATPSEEPEPDPSAIATGSATTNLVLPSAQPKSSATAIESASARPSARRDPSTVF